VPLSGPEGSMELQPNDTPFHQDTASSQAESTMSSIVWCAYLPAILAAGAASQLAMAAVLLVVLASTYHHATSWTSEQHIIPW
jgi:hypothetical protein